MTPPAPADTAVDPALDAAEADAFRDRCRRFLDEHAPSEPASDGPDDAALGSAKRFQAALVDAGLAGLTYPTEYGGAGLTAEHERIWREEFARVPDPRAELNISHGMCLPILNDVGTPDQKQRFMAPLIAAETVWCQLLSEPGAGSDIASLQTRAERDGDEWVINGQKVWTTLAHVSEYGIVLARTNPDVPKHAGISMFIVDMGDPTIEVRPIHQIDGDRRFNEVFFTDTRIPADWLLGRLDDGWRQANSVLMYERAAIGASASVTRPFSERLIAEAVARGRMDDPVLRQELTKLWCEETTHALVDLRARAAHEAGKPPGPSGSLGKLHTARVARSMRALTGAVVGASLTAGAPDDPAAGWAKEMLSSLAASIGGGTDEIQRNIIGERVLGLPREPAVDRDTPFRQLKVGTQ